MSMERFRVLFSLLVLQIGVCTSALLGEESNEPPDLDFYLGYPPDNPTEATKIHATIWSHSIEGRPQISEIWATKYIKSVGSEKPVEFFLGHLWKIHFLLEQGKVHQAAKLLSGDGARALEAASRELGGSAEALALRLRWRLMEARVQTARGVRPELAYEKSPFFKDDQESAEFDGLDLVFTHSLAYARGINELRIAIDLLDKDRTASLDRTVAAQKSLQAAITSFENTWGQWLKTKEERTFYRSMQYFLPIMDRDLQAVAGRLYFHHAMACTLQLDIAAAQKSMKRLRELAPEWGVLRIANVSQDQKATALNNIERLGTLGRSPTWLDPDKTGEYAADCYEARGEYYAFPLGKRPEAVLDFLAAYLTVKYKFNRPIDELPPSIKARALQMQRETREKFCGWIGWFQTAGIELAVASMDPPLPEYIVRAEARRGFPDRALRAYAKFLMDTRPEKPPHVAIAGEAIFRGNTLLNYWEIRGGIVSNRRLLESNLALLVESRSKVDFDKVLSFNDGYFIRTKPWTDEERRVLNQFGPFPDYVMDFRQPLTPEQVKRRREELKRLRKVKWDWDKLQVVDPN